MHKVRQPVLGAIAAAVVLFLAAGCSSQSYPEAKLKESLQKICLDEFGINVIDVKVAGETIGVFLPLSKLFDQDNFKTILATGKIRNIETLFEPSPEALEKIEDVLSAISRVILSTDKKLQFYILQATDVEKTGLEIILQGNVDDVRRVRIWDISRNEYRKRVIHEMRLNRAVLWHRPVRDFFKDLETLTPAAIQEKYFGQGGLHSAAADQLFLNNILGMPYSGQPIRWEIQDMRSVPLDKREVLVYVKVIPRNMFPTSAGEEPGMWEYLFMMRSTGEETTITRILPFQYVDQNGQILKTSFPKEFELDKILSSGEQEFHIEEIKLGSFLANQLTRRVQGLISGDERIQNTFRNIRLEFEYHEEGDQPPYFSLNLDASLRDFNNYSSGSLMLHEDMLYFLTLASKEFVEVVRSYNFKPYHYLSLNVSQEPIPFILQKDDLELFRRNKIALVDLIGMTKL